MNLRRGSYDTENEQTTRAKADRMAHRPRSLLRWLTSEYALEAPAKLHTGSQLEEDGDPAMTGEAKQYVGLAYPPRHKDQTLATDWREVACATDEDGKYKSPMRCAIARVSDPDERNYLSELACNLLFPEDVDEANGVPRWVARRYRESALEALWLSWRDAPLPRRSRPSESQAIAEAETAA